VDVGINFNEAGKLVGDVSIAPGDEERVSPVPGGVGLLTRLRLLKNVVSFYTR
jgi:methylenetetrahydrofolate dehydrogenase (NADP+)/methenyltetrahydrofolate cyclohydrolase